MILLFVAAISVILIIISYYQWQLGYWKRRGIPGPSGTLFIGNMHSLTNTAKPVGLVLREWTKIYGKVYGIQEGIQKTLVVSDIDMVRELFIKKFDCFHGRKTHALSGDVENDERVHLFKSQGVRWKRLRAISSPAFSSGSLKKIRPTVEDSVLELIKLVEKRADQQAFDVLPYYKEFTMDVISRIAMGQQGSKMFTDDRMTCMDKIVRRSFRQPLFYLANIVPRLQMIIQRIFLTTSTVKQSPVPLLFKQIYKTIDDRIEKRKSPIERRETQSVDFIDLFLDARAEQQFDNSSDFTKSGGHVEKQLTREEIAAQCFVFLLAGFDTTANSLAYITFLLARNPDAQRHLQEEIDQHCGDTISYATISAMKYLDCVMKEGLRMYPVASFANSRRCMKSTTLKNIPIEEGTFVAADTFSLHYDPEIWGTDAEEFIPDRWIDGERAPAAWLAFGLGPRQCIGMRLAYMEVKLVLAHILKRFDIVITDTTESNLNLQGSITVSPKSVTVQFRRRIWPSADI